MLGGVQAAHADGPSLVALFTFVARDSVTRKAIRVNPVDPNTEADRALFDERQRVADDRRAQRAARPAPPAPGAATSGGNPEGKGGISQTLLSFSACNRHCGWAGLCQSDDQ